MEVFAGATLLTSLAASMHLPVSTPVDIQLDGTDLLKSSVRDALEAEIERLLRHASMMDKS